MKTETIIAQVTAPGRGGVGILRISGTATQEVAKAVLTKVPQPRLAEYLPFYGTNGEILDRGIALFFPRPHSFTGEDVLELQGHGGSVVLDMLLKRILHINNVRIARPGEFSQRAFLNNKIDLAQAEAIADLINASSEQAAQSAMASLQGVFSQQINQLVDDLINLRTLVEAAIDFPDEEIDFLSDGRVVGKLQGLLDKLDQIGQQARQGTLLREGIKVVIAGRPNAGKSSLLNALVGDDMAIVTDTEGTTRDVLQASIDLGGIPLHVIDTAGLRHSDNQVERIGIERAWQQIEKADHLLFLVDSTVCTELSDEPLWQEIVSRLPHSTSVTVIKNKIDVSGESIGKSEMQGYALIKLSVKTGQGLDTLRQHLKESVGWLSTTEGSFIARRRHLDALVRAREHLLYGKKQLLLYQASELLAEELRQAQLALSEITGQFSSDDLLGQIFSSFCIGK